MGLAHMGLSKNSFKQFLADFTCKLEFHKGAWNHLLLSDSLVLDTGQSLFLLLLGLSACHVTELQHS